MLPLVKSWSWRLFSPEIYGGHVLSLGGLCEIAWSQNMFWLMGQSSVCDSMSLSRVVDLRILES